jgi:DnaJ-class molecular chaperone
MYGKKLQVSLAAATQHGNLIRVNDEGFWNAIKQKRGDMYIQICIEVPKVLDEAEKNLLRKLATKQNFTSLFPGTLSK